MSDPGTRRPDEIADAVLTAGKFRIYLGAEQGIDVLIIARSRQVAEDDE
jgi:hypothetical protein